MIDIGALKKKKTSLYQKIRAKKLKGENVSTLEREYESLSDAIIKAKVELKTAKLKAKQAAKAKIAEERERARQAKKKAAEEKGNKWADIGIPDYTNRCQREYWVYKIWKANRARLDRTKYPDEKNIYIEDSPMFAERKDAEKECKKLEKKDREHIYFARVSVVPESEIPTRQLKKIKESSWNRNKKQTNVVKVDSGSL